MNRISYVFITIFLLSSCSHSIVRTGYNKPNSEYSTCDVIIKKQMAIPATLKKVGEIKLGESGFSITCSEKHALEILRKEACSLNATVINIIDEVRPDLLSSCYRCMAEFYISTDPNTTYQNDEQYNSSNVDSRVSHDRTRNTFLAIGAFGLGCVLALISF